MSYTWATLGAILALLVLIVAGLAGERRAARRRRALQRLYQFCERLAASRTSAESLHLVQSELPQLLGVTEVRVYLQDRASRSMQRLEAAGAPSPAAVPVMTPERVRFRERSVDLCFRNRSLIATPDTRRSPLFDPSQAAETPRSMAFVPMFAGGDVLGVMAAGDADKIHHFSEEDRVVLQHLANQVAIGVKLLERSTLRDRGVGGERLDVQCRLLATAAGELRQPLAEISALSQSLAQSCPEDTCRSEARSIAGHGGVALGMVAWVLRFAGLHREPEQAVDLAALLRGMLARREHDWRERGLSVRSLVSPGPIFVSTPAGILEQILSSLLRHAEDKLLQAGTPCLTVRASHLAATAQVDVSWPPPPETLERPEAWTDGWVPADDVLSLAVCRDLIVTLGGQMKIARASDESTRLELELPLSRPGLFEAAGLQRVPSRPSARLTALVLEPDPAARQALVGSLSDLGHRAVPASSAEEAAELSRRMVFHVIFCSSSLAGATWLECLQATRDRIRTFVLLTQIHDPALAAALPAGEGYVLATPPRPEELDRILQQAGARLDS